MRRWRRDNSDEDFSGEPLSFEDLDDDDDDDDGDASSGRPSPRSVRERRRPRHYDFDDEDDDSVSLSNDIETFDRLEGAVRSGSYVPKPDDPYTLHILYQSLISRGEIT